jgi:hypothetical protein
MRRAWAGALAVACTLAIAAGSATAGAAVTERAGTQITGPKWDPKLAPIAAEVEAIRGLKFEHAVPVHYLSDAAFEKRLLRDDDPTPTASRSAAFRRSEDELRALGLLDHGIDLHASSRAALGSDTLAFYDPRTQDVYVRGTDTTAPATRVTLAHELTHALQDQHFNLRALQRSAAKHDNSSVVKGIIEGDASYVQHQFADELSDAQKQAYQQTESSQIAEARSLDVPEIIKVNLSAPYALGEALVLAVHAAKGSRGVDALFQDPPASELALVDPSSTLRKTSTADVGTPKLGPGETPVGKPTDLGAFGLFVVLASRLPAADAVAAADLWRGDRLVQFERDGRPCVRVGIAGADAASTAKIGHALDEWAAASGGTGAQATPVAARGSSGGSDGVAELTSCAPDGATTPIPANTLLDATRLLSERNALTSELAKVFGTGARAQCVATKLVADAGFQQVVERIDGGAVTADAGHAELARVVAGIRDQVLAACG